MSVDPVRRLLVVGCVIVAVAAVSAAAGAADTGAKIEQTWAQTDDSPNATETRHEQPDAVTQSGNRSALEQRLSAALADRLSESARSIEAGEYDAAQRSLAAGYERQLELYMEVYRSAVTADLERVEQRETRAPLRGIAASARSDTHGNCGTSRATFAGSNGRSPRGMKPYPRRRTVRSGRRARSSRPRRLTGRDKRRRA